MLKKISTVVLIFSCLFSYAQEIVVPLANNPLLDGLSKKYSHYKSSSESILIPFFDDFSNYSLYPDSNLWVDRYAFVNTQYAINPVSIGVATLDALDENGKLHSTAGPSQFPADTLTSKNIRLDSVFEPTINALKALKKSDSLYFSFYFQPGGGRGNPWERLGDAPEKEDSLVLEFYSPTLQNWFHIWSSTGLLLDSIYLKTGHYFKYVLIPIIDSAKFFHKEFKFRFRNYCSLGNNIIPSWSGNCDQWNIDYIYLDKQRSKTDTSFRDLTFVEKAPSFLKKYQSMPASQFQIGDLKDTLYIKLSNLDDTLHYSEYKYEIRNNGILVHTEDRGPENIKSFWTNGYQDLSVHSKPPVTYHFQQPLNSPKNFEIRHIFKKTGPQDFRPENDTNIFNQIFDNYYAYDDGSAENGYGLSPAGSKLAYKFYLNQPDTLVAVEIFFNSTLNQVNQKLFYLTIWGDNGSGKPGDTIYRSNLLLPVFENQVNKFHSYILDRQIKVNGNIFIGWTQTTDDNLNVGFDRNTSSEENIFYNTSGTWVQSFQKGSLMIRPRFGTNYLNINYYTDNKSNFSIFPNPLNNGILQIQMTELDNNNENSYELLITDLSGKLIFKSKLSKTIDLSYLKDGLYFISLVNTKTGFTKTKKLVISKNNY